MIGMDDGADMRKKTIGGTGMVLYNECVCMMYRTEEYKTRRV